MLKSVWIIRTVFTVVLSCHGLYVLYNLKKSGEYNLGEDVYPIVAKHYNTVANNIKCNITNSTDKMFYDCEEKVLRAYLKEFTFTKPGPKKIMEAVIKRL